MKKIQLFLLVVITLTFVTKSFSQRGRVRITNGFSIGGGISQFDISTDNFITKQGSGFVAGFLSNVDLSHKWYNVSFGMQFSENTLGISARPSMLANSNPEEFIDFKLMKVQLAMLLNVKVIKNYLTIDVGPIIQYNGKLELKDESQANYYINNYANLLAEDISDISNFNLNGAIGASAGVRNFKVKAQYIYGITNILNKLNNENLDTTGGNTSFKGNQSMLVLGAAFIF